MDKVRLPRDTAREIEQCRVTHSERDLIYIAIADHHVNGCRNMQALANADFDTFIKAIVNGYEVEETPEDKVRAYYDAQFAIPGPERDSTAQAVAKVLDMLGIAIKGVNA